MNIIKHLSFSSLLEFSKSPAEFHLRYILGEKKEASDSQAFGSLVDILLTTPEKYDELYAVYNGKVPTSAQQLGFATDLINAYRNGINLPSDVVYSKYYKVEGKSEAAIVKAAKELFIELQDYMNFKIEAANKIEISSDYLEKAQNTVNGISSNPLARTWMADLPGEYQKKIMWTSNGIPIPIMSILDKVIVDHTQKRAKVVELKSLSGTNEFDFMKSARAYKYPMQAAMYITALTHALFLETGETYDVSHVTVAVKNEKPFQSFVMEYSENDLNIGYSQFYELANKVCERNALNKWEHNNNLIQLKVYREKED